jgi:polysaccharide export outer membrane protein
MKSLKLVMVLTLVVAMVGCKSYTSNVILKTDDGDENWQATYNQTVIEFPIKIGDKIQFSLYTNEGESIIDPTGKLFAPAVQNTDGTTNNTAPSLPVYEVLENGECLFPLLGKINVLGLKTSQLDSLLVIKYGDFYNGVYVRSKVVNKKLVVLGPQGGKLVPYTSNINLIEVIAVYGGLDNNSKGFNIRIIRGDLKNPQVKVVNLKTIADMKSSIVSLQPDDMIYIEPVRRPAAESIRDNIYILNVVQVIVTLTVLFTTLTK